jgi:hypothetical protein
MVQYNYTDSILPFGETRKMKDEPSTVACDDLSNRFAASARPALTVDIERYQAYLDWSEMTDAQKEAFLQALWSLLMNFVELGFGVHPLQEVCGESESISIERAKYAFDEVRSDKPDIEDTKPTPHSQSPGASHE